MKLLPVLISVGCDSESIVLILPSDDLNMKRLTEVNLGIIQYKKNVACRINFHVIKIQ